MVNYYLSNLVFGFGRFVVVTTAEPMENKNILAEAYIFGLDSPGHFKGTWVQYQHSEGDESISNIDLDFMRQEALNQAKNIINEYQFAKYQETKDVNFMKSNLDFQDCRSEVLVTLKNGGYREDLEQIANDTHSSELREYLKAILAFKISIRKYEKTVR